jgi:hypothetical protein
LAALRRQQEEHSYKSATAADRNQPKHD